MKYTGNRPGSHDAKKPACKRLFSAPPSDAESSDDEPVQNTGREQTFAIEQTVQDATEQTVATEQTDVIDLTKSSPAQTVVTEQTVAGTLVTSRFPVGIFGAGRLKPTRNGGGAMIDISR